MDITGRKLIIKALRAEKTDMVFAYPGGMVTDIFDELYKADDIRLVLPRHEQALIHEAEGYARATGKTGVCIVTSGPGATNIITGLADAHFDSVPLVVITGQVPLPLIGNDAFQEVDIVGMTRSVTKYGVTVRDREDLGRILKMAFYIARSGRPGPVLIDIPKDIQVMSGSPEYPEKIAIRGYKPNTSVHVGQLKKAYKLLHSAKKPLILAGGGVRISRAEKDFLAFVERTRVPVVTTVMGKGIMTYDHPLYFGNCGMHGEYAANMAITECDVLFSIGTRFNDRITGDLKEFAPNAQIVHIDIDTSSISRNVDVDVPVVADAGLAISTMLEYAEEQDTAEWITRLSDFRAAHPLRFEASETMNPQYIMRTIGDILSPDIIVTDVGQHQMWASQYMELRGDGRFITSGGLGTMGFGFPAAVGAKLGAPGKRVVCITGDGGMQMNMQEMATAIVEGVNFTVCIINNSFLGMVRQIQHMFYGKRYCATYLGKKDHNGYVPDFVKWAESYGALGLRAKTPDELGEALDKARANEETPTVIEILVSSDELVLPMVKSGNPMSEMIF